VLIACLEMYKNASFPVGTKKRIDGLRLVATDVDWSHGTGPEVTGPAMSMVMAMTGRAAGLDELGGEGLATLRRRNDVDEVIGVTGLSEVWRCCRG